MTLTEDTKLGRYEICSLIGVVTPQFDVESFTYEGFLEDILRGFHAKQRVLN